VDNNARPSSPSTENFVTNLRALKEKLKDNDGCEKGNSPINLRKMSMTFSLHQLTPFVTMGKAIQLKPQLLLRFN
jgi:hypothetical protein